MSDLTNVKINSSLTLPSGSYSDLLPGEILMFPVSTSVSDITTILDLANNKSHFFECNGDSFSKTTYSLLYDVIGDRFGTDDDGSPKIPNLNASSNNDCVMIRGDDSMSEKSKINSTSEATTSNKINYLPEHNSQHEFVVNSVNISSFNYNEDSIKLKSNNQKYITGLDTAVKNKSNAGNGIKSLNLSNHEHSHSYEISSKGHISSHKEFIKSSSVNSNQISVSENSTNTQNYVFPSIKLKYFIFTGISDGVNSAYVDNTDANTEANYDSNNKTTYSSFIDLSINKTLKVSSNRVIEKPNKIIIYAGSTPPNGYVWCDGNNGTPDLTERFITSTTSSSTVGKYTNNNSKSNKISSFPGHSHTVTIDGDNKTSHNVKYTADLTYNKFGSLKGMKKSGVNKNVAWKSKSELAGDHEHDFTKSTISNDLIAFKTNEKIPVTDASGVKYSIEIEQDETNNTSEFIPAYVPIGFIMKET